MIVRGGRGDAHRAAVLIATAFHGLDVAAWLVPDPQERERVLYANFRTFVDHAVEHGDVLMTEDGRGVAVWFPRAAPLPDIDDYERRRWLACGPHTVRFQILDTAFDQRHPTVEHHHLGFLAVHPDHQGGGVGTALLDRYHHRLDRAGLPAYLEASSPQNRRLYRRHGYRDHGAPIELTRRGPRLWPMWRTPREPGTSKAVTRERETADVVDRYTGGGETIRDIGEQLGMSYGKVHKLLVESGTSLRAPGAQRRWGHATTELEPR